MGHTMKILTATLLALALPALNSAVAMPYGGAQVSQTNIQAAPMAGLRLTKAVLVETAAGREVRGSVCRTPSQTATGRVGIQLQQRDASGKVINQSRLQLPTTLGVSDRACATFALPVTWAVASGEALQICADRVGRAGCSAN
jgi:hypothetical protein